MKPSSLLPNPPAAAPFASILVANRGEIAVRIIRAARELGLRSIAVYSDADRRSAHVFAADEAYRLGASPAAESYLAADRLLEIARDVEAEAIHPGYGFLSERAGFARSVEDAGLVFVGPSSATISAMGDKTRARATMAAAGVPVVPGSPGPVADPDDARRVAEGLGYPLLLKAAAGGGGKGMRVVRDEEEIAIAFEMARREAEGAFGDGSLFLERYLERPRHIEVQVLGDAHGNIVHLGERECSIQRRHQKLMEEAPAPSLTDDERGFVHAAALKAARAVEYRSAGTVEFLFERDEFHFLEMNTRIQVEHPVTELVSGIDIVTAQLEVAMGRELEFSQEDVAFAGHAIECRIAAEDASFLPATGRVRELWVPSGPGTRWDGGIVAGQEVTLHYDSLLGKVIVHAPDRARAICRMERALDELVVAGVETTTPFHRRLLAHPAFQAGELSIRFLEEYPELASGEETDLEPLVALAAVLSERGAVSGVAPRLPLREPVRPGWRGRG